MLRPRKTSAVTPSHVLSALGELLLPFDSTESAMCTNCFCWKPPRCSAGPARGADAMIAAQKCGTSLPCGRISLSLSTNRTNCTYIEKLILRACIDENRSFASKYQQSFHSGFALHFHVRTYIPKLGQRAAHY